MKVTKILAAAAIISFATAGSALAFHSGGVADCEGCHTMHNTVGSGKAIPLAKGTGQGAVFLLQGTDASSACMNCHNPTTPDTAPSGYHIASDGGGTYAAGVAPVEMTPGGDFGWLKKSYTFSVRGSAVPVEEGYSHGHDINATDYGYTGTNNATAPGSTALYPQASLACSSCHDPHGKYRRDAAGVYATTGLPIFGSGSYGTSAAPIASVSAVGAYRILAGVGYLPKSMLNAGLSADIFTAPPPDAVAPSSYNRSEATGQTHVAYGQGMSEWCANCHDLMLENAYASGVVNHRHPAGNSAKMTTAIVANYNTYVTSGVMTSTDPIKAYSTLAPFEMGTPDRSILNPLAVNTDTKDQSAVAGTSNVMCLSCHRAHASAFPDMARYNLDNEFMTVADASNAAAYDSSTTEGKINHGKTVAEQTAAYYGRPASAFGPYARDYCNKCHAKD